MPLDWKVAHQARSLSGLVTRLIEEATRRAETSLATRALDSLDRLVESGVFQDQQVLLLLTAT
jgi:hypothetical protein